MKRPAPAVLKASADAGHDGAANERTILMGEMIKLTAADGHTFAAYRAVPNGQPKGGIVIIQEIFGLTEQMKRVGDRYAAAGYLAIVPAMFDRVERDVALKYAEVQKGFGIVQSLNPQNTLADLDAAREAAAEGGEVAIMGYCWGGTIAYLGVSKLDFACAVSYYGGSIVRLIAEMKPKAPVMYQFGEKDTHIPLSDVDKIKAGDPKGIFHIYKNADHGFCCDDRASYNEEACTLSEKRTLEFLDQHL